MNFSYYHHINCNDEFTREFTEVVMVDADKNYTFRGAFPLTIYSVQASVVNSGDFTSDFTTSVTVETLPGLNLSFLMKKWFWKQNKKLFQLHQKKSRL